MGNYKTPGVYVEHVPSGSAPIAGAGTSTAAFVGVVPGTTPMETGKTLTAVGEVKLITNFTEFKDAFGNYSGDAGHDTLAHAVYGFFLNGGTRCYVTRIAPPAGDWTNAAISVPLELFEAIDEIAIVAAPGLWGAVPYTDLVAHCEKMKTRVAIVDTAEELIVSEGDPPAPTVKSLSDFIADLQVTRTGAGGSLPAKSDYAALYFPWISVYDPKSNAPKLVPPSGHIAGIYARVDAQRGVHKAPANETILGSLDLKYSISRAQQAGLNDKGVNCIRRMNGSIKVWGARTVGADGEFKYLNVRRVFNFLRASIDRGTQWAVFEPNDPDLWAKITRNVTAFLTITWNGGALFGNKAEEAFYVKCDAETNPPSLRDLGQVVTEIGVAITRPAEFVIFRLGQKAAS